jgi:hypothetical protein
VADSRTIKALRKENVAKASFHLDGSLASVEFFAVAARVQPDAKPSREAEVKFVPGTQIPDDKTPLNPLDSILNPPTYNPHEVS